MPITVHADIKQISQHEFAELSYGVMKEVFALHRELGRLFDEKVYRDALVQRLSGAQSEVQIDVCFDGFCKSYFMDLLVSSGGVFELKAVESIANSNRSQLMNYLLLSELQHGKLVNMRPESVGHEFVNATRTHEERVQFEVDDSHWKPLGGFAADKKEWGGAIA